MDSKLLEKVLAESGNAADQVAEMNARYAAIGLSVPSSDMFLGGQLKPRRLKPPCDYCGQADGTKKCTSCKRATSARAETFKRVAPPPRRGWWAR
jgi:hypothetical protein